MVRPINLKDYKEELDYIREERANLDLREVGTLKKIKELFNAEVKDFLNGGFKVIKIEKDAHRTIYGIVDKIEYSAWNNGKKVITSGINLYGALLNYNPARDFYTATNMICLPILQRKRTASAFSRSWRGRPLISLSTTRALACVAAIWRPTTPGKRK